MTGALRRLVSRRGDTRAATVIEFAIVSPVMMMMIMGLGDVLYQIYAQSLLNGALQKAGRDSSIQGGDILGSTLDGKVVSIVGTIVKNPANSCAAAPSGATWCSTRRNYDNFTEVAPEPFTDTNGNGQRDPGECFSDVNNNGTWDADPGANGGFGGQGGASAVTLYTMRITYPRLFPVAGLLGWSSTATIKATTLLKNQPYATQVNTTTPTKSVCT